VRQAVGLRSVHTALVRKVESVTFSSMLMLHSAGSLHNCITATLKVLVMMKVVKDAKGAVAPQLGLLLAFIAISSCLSLSALATNTEQTFRRAAQVASVQATIPTANAAADLDPTATGYQDVGGQTQTTSLDLDTTGMGDDEPGAAANSDPRTSNGSITPFFQ